MFHVYSLSRSENWLTASGKQNMQMIMNSCGLILFINLGRVILWIFDSFLAVGNIWKCRKKLPERLNLTIFLLCAMNKK